MYKTHHFLKYKNASMHYSQFGEGKDTLICFHGYGQNIENFSKLENALKETYTIYSFDLFYHGRSFWNDNENPLTKDFWRSMMDNFLKEKKIEKFSLLGFSMGGKFAIATMELFPEQVDKLILIAPDGIKTSFWYSLATYPIWIRKIFKSVIAKPNIYFGLVKILEKLRLLDKGLLRFANSQMTTMEQRERVYYSWVVFRKLSFDMSRIALILNKNNIKLEMFLGKYDKIITLKNMGALLNKVEDYQLNVLESGHSGLIDAVAKHYSKEF